MPRPLITVLWLFQPLVFCLAGNAAAEEELLIDPDLLETTSELSTLTGQLLTENGEVIALTASPATGSAVALTRTGDALQRSLPRIGDALQTAITRIALEQTAGGSGSNSSISLSESHVGEVYGVNSSGQPQQVNPPAP